MSKFICYNLSKIFLASFLILAIPAVLAYTIFRYPSPVIITDQEPRFPNITNWCYIEFKEDHRGRSANQPLNERTCLEIPILLDLKIMQITPYNAKGKVGNGLYSYIFKARTSFSFVFVELEYWGRPWKLYIGGNVGFRNGKMCEYLAVKGPCFSGSPFLAQYHEP